MNRKIALRTAHLAVLLAAGAVGTVPGEVAAQGMGGPERQLVAQFDRDGNGRLDATERAAARAAPATASGGGQGRGGFGGPGGGGPPGGFGGGGGGGGRGGGNAQRAVGTPGIQLTPADVKSYGSENLYDRSVLRTIFLQFESADWEQELVAFNNTDVEVPATVIVDGKTYPEVGVHFRGASSFGVGNGSKRSLNLSFDFVDEDQRLGGYRTLNLLNMANDPTMLRTVLYSQIAQDFIQPPKANFVHVVINGENWGVYTNVQQFNKDMIGDYFDETGGARWTTPGSPNGRAGMVYLGDDINAYRTLYEIKTDDDPEDWAKLINLFKVLNQTPVDQLEAALRPIMDIDGVLKFLALDVALVNSDGYWTRASDYNIYMDPQGVFRILPHDMNEGLGLSGQATLDPLVAINDASKPLRSKLLAVPALRERYQGYVREIATKWLDWNTVSPFVEQYRTLIGPEARRDTRKLFTTEAFDTEVASLKNFMDQRRAFLLQ